ncbi:MAG: peptidoglycan bridge formation glycyltransferase FemA/FemB family protein [Bacteroidia bacterium]|nr:peptidoglycan bridge formation glycyltransferase FemA/FemB family protein [Bacteroidia bacterium]
MTIVELNKSSAGYPDLKQFVEKHALLFNSEQWLNVYPEASIRQCAILNKNNEVIGCFIYFRFKKKGITFVITPPFSPNSALFYVNPAESVVGRHSFDKDVSTLVADYFDALSVPYFNLYLPYHAADTQPFTWKGFISKTRYSYLIDLHKSEEALWNNLSSEKRKSINKAQKDGLEVKETEDYHTVFNLIMQSLERNDKDRNEQVIKNILFSFANKKNAIAYMASNDGKAIGASFCVVDRNRAVYIF